MFKNIIFDLCGPIITLDLEMMNRRFRDFGVTAADKPYQCLREKGLTKRFEQGVISPKDFCAEVRSVLGCDISDNDIFECWNTVVSSFPHHHAELLNRLSKRYKLFLLSNSDVVNAKFFHDYINLRAGADFLERTFSGVFFSCDLRLRKPDPDVFRKVACTAGINLADTVFIDDCRGHVESATGIGLKSVLLPQGSDIADLFDENLELLA